MGSWEFRTRWLLSVALLVLLLGVAGFTMWRNMTPTMTDASADWLAISAARQGLNPWTDLLELSNSFGVRFEPIGASEIGSGERVHPRTPGALLLLSPFALLEYDHAYLGAIASIAVAFLGTAVWLAISAGGASGSRILLAAACGTCGTAFLATLEFGTHAAWLTLLITGTVLTTRDKDSITGGVLLGLAVVLRLYPALILIPMLMMGKKRAVFAASGTFGFLTVLGIWVFHLSPIAAVAALMSASERWMGFSGNGSLAKPLADFGVPSTVAVVALALVGFSFATWVGLNARRGLIQYELAVLAVLVMALVCSPLSWEHYDLVLIPGLLLLMTSPQRRPLVLAVGVWALIQLSVPWMDGAFATQTQSWTGALTLLGRLVLVAATAYVIRSSIPVPERSSGRRRAFDDLVTAIPQAR